MPERRSRSEWRPPTRGQPAEVASLRAARSSMVRGELESRYVRYGIRLERRDGQGGYDTGDLYAASIELPAPAAHGARVGAGPYRDMRHERHVAAKACGERVAMQVIMQPREVAVTFVGNEERVREAVGFEPGHRVTADEGNRLQCMGDCVHMRRVDSSDTWLQPNTSVKCGLAIPYWGSWARRKASIQPSCAGARSG